ncbi:DNA-directed RNA polymerase subunit L [Candidatus Woesearchaeota archaeon]|nr:DNA-directed RNA polymerase subunit L [Candidatus Woesearchaeota archaeon]
MEAKVTENKKNKLIFELKGADHTVCNILKTELWNDDHVKTATYSIKHPQISSPEFIIETDGSATPKSALTSAVNRLKKVSDKFRKEITSEL